MSSNPANDFKAAAAKRSDAVFATAPRAGSVIVFTWITWAIVLSVVMVNLLVVLSRAQQSGRTHAMVIAGSIAVVLAVILIAAWFCSKIRNLTLSGQTLSINLTFWTATCDLAGLRSVEPDASALKGVMRTFGNGGFGAFHGFFFSKRMGKFRGYVTDASRCVVLRWESKCVVVSPDDTEHFIEEVCKRTGVRRQS